MARHLILLVVAAFVVTTVLCVPAKNRAEKGKLSKKWNDWYYDGYNDDYWYNYWDDGSSDWYYNWDYDWSDWSNYDYGYGWDNGDYWDDCQNYYGTMDSYDWGKCDYGEVECISGACVNVDDLCTGLDSCSSIENDYFCSDYYYNYQCIKRKSVKRGTDKKADEKILKAKAYSFAKSHPSGGKHNKRTKSKTARKQVLTQKPEGRRFKIENLQRKRVDNIENILKSLQNKHIQGANGRK